MAIFKSNEPKPEYHAVQDSDEEQEHHPTPVPRVAYNPKYLILGFLILFLSVGWTVTAISFWKSLRQTNGPLHVYSFTPIPREVFTPVKKVFQPDERYIGNSREVDHYWDALVAGHDAVWIEDPERWNLPEGIVAPYDHPNETDPPQQNFYVISILHQLHCLNMVRFQFWQARTGVDLDTEHDSEKWNVHVLHCFEYLRQAISCGGDLIIEGSSPIKVGKGHATSVTGWGVEHDCINFDLLRRFQIDQERKYNETWQQGLY